MASWLLESLKNMVHVVIMFIALKPAPGLIFSYSNLLLVYGYL